MSTEGLDSFDALDWIDRYFGGMAYLKRCATCIPHIRLAQVACNVASNLGHPLLLVERELFVEFQVARALPNEADNLLLTLL